MKPLVFILSFSILVGTIGATPKKLLLVDTAQNERYAHDGMMQLAQNVGFETDYVSIGQIIDANQHELGLDDSDAIFFLLSVEFLNNMHSLVGQKILDLLASYAKIPNKMVGLIFPSGYAVKNGIVRLNQIFSRLGLETKGNRLILPEHLNQAEKKSVATFAAATGNFLSIPTTARGIEYHTTIFPPQPSRASLKGKIHNENLATIPINNNYSSQVKKLLPHGIYWHNPMTAGNVFVGTDILRLGSISENFRLVPMDPKLKENLLSSLQQVMWELSNVDHNMDIETVLNTEQPALPRHFREKTVKVGNERIKCPWMAIEHFYSDEGFKQDEFIDNLLRSDFSHLWISISPNWYYSPIAIRNKAEGISSMSGLQQIIQTFTHKLEAHAAKLGKKIPKILIGFEIANNIRNQNIPYKKPAKGLYGTEYKAAPSPLSKEFWDDEVVNPLVAFLDDWRKITDIPISGVTLDLEMYIFLNSEQRAKGFKSSGAFLSTMGFNEETFNKFKQDPSIQAGTMSATIGKSKKSIQQYLVQNRLGKAYFDFLYNSAIDLGDYLSSTFRSLIPDCVIGCYAPNISTDWFYKGLYRGLSKADSIILFTFNTEFYKHRNWLLKNGINAKHCSALMLSKIVTLDDVKKVSEIINNHDGVWFNRFSTIGAKYEKHLEHTPLAKSPQSLRELSKRISKS